MKATATSAGRQACVHNAALGGGFEAPAKLSPLLWAAAPPACLGLTGYHAVRRQGPSMSQAAGSSREPNQ